MMNIKVNAESMKNKDKLWEIELHTGATIYDCIRSCGLDLRNVKTAKVNDMVLSLNSTLREGDEVYIIDPEPEEKPILVKKS